MVPGVIALVRLIKHGSGSCSLGPAIHPDFTAPALNQHHCFQHRTCTKSTH
ncbi:hypothetical protein AOXY_G37049, partial [Acipenser oxyrinchus oxyrinchus]